MTTRYQKRHYEDVARILRPFADDSLKSPDGQWDTVEGCIVRPFADLFAADNPGYCSLCGHEPPIGRFCVGTFGNVANSATHHALVGGFDREQFLAACGLDIGS